MIYCALLVVQQESWFCPGKDNAASIWSCYLFFYMPGMKPLSLFLVSFMRWYLGKVKQLILLSQVEDTFKGLASVYK